MSGWASPTPNAPMIAHAATPANAGGVPNEVPIPIPPAPDQNAYLYDITFYPLDPLHLKGVAVGGSWGLGTGFVIYTTVDHGASWKLSTIPMPGYANAQLRGVRFVSANRAYAYGGATDTLTGLGVPLLVEIDL